MLLTLLLLPLLLLLLLVMPMTLPLLLLVVVLSLLQVVKLLSLLQVLICQILLVPGRSLRNQSRTASQHRQALAAHCQP
jgi:hypothetical protein